MKCCVDGCDREAHYKEKQLCQKHYFRQWRRGTTDIVRKPARPRYEDERGYQFIHAPKHPLCNKGQIFVAEHRVVLYGAIGPGPMCCALCGKELTWATCDVDHIDENPRNNARDNLRPTCMPCNTKRGRLEEHKYPRRHAITFDGVTLTPQEWARDPRVSLSGGAIRRRLKQGMGPEQALFAPKVTHKAKCNELEKERE